MPPIYVKGGVWTNIEDEILKAAIAKYGLNQWSRVASLLTKKNAKQAKARWNEWLSPAINKTEWTREQDEKLLNLVKLLPNQWRSIAPIMGRTATHCIERYQKLLEDDDDADENEMRLAGAGVESLPGSGPATVGDLNLNPESKPARPDEDQLDEDDEEMLYEARARLANTKGKKAKRRERERMLDETKRMSLLQKRRELKAAGVNISLVSKNKKRRKDFDFNADIPHEHEPLPGLYDVTEETEANDLAAQKFSAKVQSQGLQMEPEKGKKKRKPDEPQPEPQEPDAPEFKRQKLEMPGLEDAVKTESVDIDDRIAQTTRELKEKQAVKSSLIVDSKDVPTSKTAAPVAKTNVKAIRTLLKHKFESLPTPQNHYDIMPKFSEAEEELVLVGPQDDKMQQQLSLLQQVEAEKAKLRRTQVVQRGLITPDPRNVHVGGATELETLIAAEVKRLVETDYSGADEPEGDADAQWYDQAVAMVEAEIGRGQPSPAPQQKYELPTGDAVRRQIQAKLEQLQADNEALRQQIGFPTAQVEQLWAEIEQAGNEVLTANEETAFYEKLAAHEEKVIEARSAVLHAAVERIGRHEREATQKLQCI